jgi:hypothetical protein
MSNNNTLSKQFLPFTQVPNEVINDINLSLKSIGMYSFMFSKPDGWNFTILSMSKQVKDGTTSIQSCITELKESGYLSYTKNSDGTGQYHLFITKQVESVADPVVPTENNDFDILPKEEQQKPEIPATPTVPVIDKQFNTFWDLYQYKKARPEAEKAWNKLSVVDKTAVMMNVTAFVQSTPDKNYRPHAATYLNGRRWEDELKSVSPQSNFGGPKQANFSNTNPDGSTRYGETTKQISNDGPVEKHLTLDELRNQGGHQ